MIQVHLNPDTEARLEAQARSRGVETESYVKVLIEDAVGAAPRRRGSRRVMRAFLSAMAANSDRAPQLPDDALIRESFYRDRD